MPYLRSSIIKDANNVTDDEVTLLVTGKAIAIKPYQVLHGDLVLYYRLRHKYRGKNVPTMYDGQYIYGKLGKVKDIEYLGTIINEQDVVYFNKPQ